MKIVVPLEVLCKVVGIQGMIRVTLGTEIQRGSVECDSFLQICHTGRGVFVVALTNKMRVDGVSAIDSDDPLHEVPTQLARVGWLLPNPEKAFLVYGTVHLNTMQEYSVTSAGGDGPFGEGPALTDAAR